ncbi:MAG: glycosyltransferase WbsX family protein [Lachnospiraceae bacterium]
MSDVPKILAFNLPQYHTFPENDEWWGKGFTEWVNVKEAKTMFEGHNQPRIPLNGNYYDLSEYETRKWQAELAQKYCVYGFCYYHYWFDGKLLMEKPLEALLLEKDIRLLFCLCWANEPWTRAWDGSAHDVIMPQYYGSEENWKAHIEYLMPFFKDDRYIKVDGAPLFVLYRTNNINNCDAMIKYWNKSCQDNGFKGIYIVEENNVFQTGACCAGSRGILDFEPAHVRTVGRKKGLLRILDIWDNHIVKDLVKRPYYRFSYRLYWSEILKRAKKETNRSNGIKHYFGAFVDWDNTSRRAVNGLVCDGANPNDFYKYFKQLVEYAQKSNSEFIFVNAWNEWAEGAYLEPDEKNRYGYLEAIRDVMNGN